MNCFQISIFAVANTTSGNLCRNSRRLWIAFKLVSLQLQTQLFSLLVSREFVVNCFQISIFAVANTTIGLLPCAGAELWIAFKLVSLQLQTQQVGEVVYQFSVVNCFQISIFAVANTTSGSHSPLSVLLWIAFKLVSLQLQTQPFFVSIKVCFCCELLSN